ncbi:MAG: hypothetical protein HOW73_01535 [Polyangiaceae bacterium]|nr:hypothetical protein [Polyangiaceae bacterium]
MRTWTRVAWLGAIALSAATAGGCAEERDPINRVQNDVATKSFFVGNDFEDTADDPAFYARAVVTDVGYGAAQDGLFTSTYAQPPSVIKWEITQDLLIGRIVYNRIEGSDSHGDGPSSTDGQVAYAFPIISHFDIRRDYNPTTGEETNVIVENTSDRPWDEREYMRVDWSRNLNVDAYDFDTLSLMGVYGGITYEPLSYYVNDPTSEDAPHFAFNEGYFDVTTKAFATPGVIDLSHLGWGIDSFPACFLPNDILGGSQPFGNCNPTELTLRLAFRRVETSDYEPVDWNGRKFEQFGIFYGERFGYARNYGIVDQQWHRFAARYNIWDRSHAYQQMEGECPSGWVESADYPGECEKPCYTAETTPPDQDPNRDCGADLNACSSTTPDPTKIIGNGTADECEDVGNGSQCDAFKQKCTMPYKDRTPAPIVWHYTKGSNPEYFEGTEWAANEWDAAMRTSVRFAQYGECISVKTGGGADLATAQAECYSQFKIYEGQQEENEDLVALLREVDDCRAGLGAYHDSPAGEPWSDERVQACNGVADSVGKARALSEGVIDIAKMPEMVTLCHSPIEHHDSPLCQKDIQRYMSAEDIEYEATHETWPDSTPTRRVLDDVTAKQCDEQWEARHDDPAKVDQALLDTCDRGFVARIGDLRYHQVNVIRTPQTPSPWGIMVDADDPRTGEKIHASINIWSHVNDLASQGQVDMMRYVKGELKTEDVTNGTYVRDWAQAAGASGGRGALGTMDRATVERRRFAAVDGRNFTRAEPVLDLQDVQQAEVDPEVMRLSKEFFNRKLAKVQASATVQSVNRPYTEARRLAAQNTPTEAALITPAMMQYAGFKDQAEISAAQNEISAGQFGSAGVWSASVLRGLNPQIRRDLRQARELALAARGACILSDEQVMAPAPNTLFNMADVMERKFGAFDPSAGESDQLAHGEKIRKYIAQKMQYGVIIHEMGHSIGHRHNFVSSYFAYGFRPQYWQLRTKDGTQTTACDDVSADGENCVGPRYFDPPTKTELDNLIYMFQQSSVMDYPGDVSQDMIGLGAYDFAAARMFYGNVVAVHKDDQYKLGSVNDQTILNITNTFGGIIGYQYVNKQGTNLHYSALQDKLALVHDCVTVNPDDYKPKNWNKDELGEWDPLIDGLIVGQDGTYTRCKSPKVDYVQWNRLRDAITEDAAAKNGLPANAVETRNAGFYPGGPAVDASKRLRVPYGFATDSWADLGNLAVYRHDEGADPYELFNFLITEQETRHIFDNYRRNRTTFSVRSQSERILGRYNEKMRDGAKGLGLFANLYRDFYLELGFQYDAVWPYVATASFPDNMLASGIAFDHFTRQFQRPQVGEHFAYTLNQWPARGGLNSQDLVWRSVDSGFLGPGDSNPAKFKINDGATGYFGMVSYGGKLVENRLSDGNGEYDRDYTMNAGSYYDKAYAPYLLTESVDNFISDSLGDFIDPRYRSVSMADLFPDGYRRFLANQLTGDDFLKGARLAATTPGNPAARANPTLDTEGYPSLGIGWTSWWTPEPEVCFPGENAIVCSTYGCDSGNICETTDSSTVPLASLNPQAPEFTTVVEPQVGWEEWKWLIAQTLLYLPENAKEEWINLMGIWEIGADNDPAFGNRIELHLPDGRIYVARTYGTEVIFGRTVQRGVAARMLEYANELMFNAYECDAAETRWCVPLYDANGEPRVKYDPSITNGGLGSDCSAATPDNCVCQDNRACVALEKYAPLMAFLRQSMRDFRMADASMQGIYD